MDRDGYLTRREEPADHEAVHGVTAAAFGTEVEADLVEALRADPAWIGALSWVATTRDDRVVAHALLTRCHVDDVPALCLAPCSVEPSSQRTGAGSAVIRSLLGAARDLGEAFVVVLGDPGYYPRFGFRRASESGISLPFEVPDQASMALSLDPARALPAGTVRYAGPFGL